jgi:hypothetical protein
MVGMLVGGDEAERHRITGRPFQVAAGKNPGSVAVNDRWRSRK